MPNIEKKLATIKAGIDSKVETAIKAQFDKFNPPKKKSNNKEDDDSDLKDSEDLSSDEAMSTDKVSTNTETNPKVSAFSSSSF